MSAPPKHLFAVIASRLRVVTRAIEASEKFERLDAAVDYAGEQVKTTKNNMTVWSLKEGETSWFKVGPVVVKKGVARLVGVKDDTNRSLRPFDDPPAPLATWGGGAVAAHPNMDGRNRDDE